MSKINKATGFYNSQAWKDTRQSYKRSVGYLCERCMKRGIIASADVVHHRVPLTEDTVNDLNLSLNWDNLEALCTKCHAEVHAEINGRRAARYSLDNGGRVVIDDGIV